MVDLVGYMDGLLGKPLDLWCVRNLHLPRRGEQTIDEVEALIVKHQRTYEQAYDRARKDLSHDSVVPWDFPKKKYVRVAR